MGWDPADVPDPQDDQTFERSRLDWAELDKEPHADLLEWHRRLVALRRSRPELTDGRLDRVHCTWDELAGWFVVYRSGIAVVCNLADERQTVPLHGSPDGVLLASKHGFVYRAREIDLDGSSVAIVTLVDERDEPPLRAL